MRRLFTLMLLIAALGLFGIWAAIWLTPMPVPIPSPPLTGQIDRIVINKSARQMQLFQNGQPVRTYHIALGFTPIGDKTRQGDGRTPEGRFTITRRNAASAYHLSLGIDYPQPEDLIRAAATGINPGRDIFIHGQPNALPETLMAKGDWTAGCIALTNTEMREVWRVTPTGTPVEIRP